MKDPYKTLGVPRNAGDADIKRAVRRKRAAVHPDRVQGSAAEEAIRDVNEAARILLSPPLRAKYDAGEDPTKREKPLDHKARDVILQLLGQALQVEDEYLDLVDALRQQIMMNLEQKFRAKEEMEADIARLNQRRTRFKFKGKERNFIDDWFDAQLRGMTAALEQVEEIRRAGNRALELLEQYGYEAIPRPTYTGVFAEVSLAELPSTSTFTARLFTSR